MKKVVVLMATYNGEKYLRTQLDSIVNQKGDFKLDIIVRDDCSNDSTQKILDEYQKKGFLKWYTGEKLKTAKSFIDLLYYHPGYDYYAFSDQDDFWFQDKIQRGINAIENYDTPCLYFCNLEIVDSDLKPLGFNAYKKKPCYDFYSVTANAGIAGCTFIFNDRLANVIQSTRIPQTITMHDAFLLKTCSCIDGCLVYDFNPSIKYRQHGNNVDGYPINKVSALKNRLKLINDHKQISVDQEISEIIKLYSEKIDSEKLKWLRLIVNYKKGFNRFKLAFSTKIQYQSLNMKLTRILTILRGNL